MSEDQAYGSLETLLHVLIEERIPNSLLIEGYEREEYVKAIRIILEKRPSQ